MLKLDCLAVKVYYICVQLTSSLVCNVLLSGKAFFHESLGRGFYYRILLKPTAYTRP